MKTGRSLSRELKELGGSDIYPFHMPGHKRNMKGSYLSQAYDMDITEIDGFDNLHEPAGLIKELEERAASYYDAYKAFILVNGSTAGILSAVSAAVPHRGRLLMARNSHKSAYDAVYLGEIESEYFLPEYYEEFKVYGCVDKEELAKELDSKKKPDAVLITSPTYEGFISDVDGIADIVHSHGIPLIVDAAHGAHLKVSKKADISIVSLHKTLPAFTSSALCLLNSDRVDAKRLKFYINIFQTSSPSYLLMAGIDECFDILEREGKDRKKTLEEELFGVYSVFDGCRFIKAIDASKAAALRAFGFDDTKLDIYDCSGIYTGKQIYDRLRLKYRIQPEMASQRLCLCMTSIMDTKEGLFRLKTAVKETDDDIRSGKFR